MSTNSVNHNQRDKMVLVRLTPTMTREQMKQNLIDALEKNGITVHPSPKDTNTGDAS
jgi:hypothetical protein